MYSSNLRAVPALASVSAAQAKAFLEELANLPKAQKAIDRFEKRYAPFLPWTHSIAQTSPIEKIESKETLSGITVEAPGYDPLFVLQGALQSIWKAPNALMRERMIFRFREGDLTTSGLYFSALVTPWSLSPFEQAVLYLLKQAKLTRYCQNPGCSTPYFFGQRRNQRYCSEPCSQPAQRDYKRRWWQQHGNQWRKNRAKKQKRRVRVKSK